MLNEALHAKVFNCLDSWQLSWRHSLAFFSVSPLESRVYLLWRSAVVVSSICCRILTQMLKKLQKKVQIWRIISSSNFFVKSNSRKFREIDFTKKFVALFFPFQVHCVNTTTTTSRSIIVCIIPTSFPVRKHCKNVILIFGGLTFPDRFIPCNPTCAISKTSSKFFYLWLTDIY